MSDIILEFSGPPGPSGTDGTDGSDGADGTLAPATAPELEAGAANDKSVTPLGLSTLGITREWLLGVLGFNPVGAESDWAFSIGEEGGPTAGFMKNGKVIGLFEAPAFDPTTQTIATALAAKPMVPITALVALGDSTAEGAGASSSATSWRGLVAARLGISIVNMGIGGSFAEQIAARYGAVPTILTVSGNSIPASG